MNLKSVGQRLLTGGLREMMMSTDAWMEGSMHDDLSHQLSSLFLMHRVKSAQFEHRHMQLLIAESRRRVGIIESQLEPVSVQMQTVSDRDLQLFVRDDLQLLWALLDRPFGL
jgi:hypothetical protein